MLVRNGHEVVGVMVGVSHSREVPDFFSSVFDCDIELLDSPSFVFKNNRSISLPATISHTVGNLGNYRRSVKKIKQIVEETKADILINFYEPTAGLFKRFYPEAIPSIAVGHQFMLEHPDYVSTDKFKTQKMGMVAFNRLVGSNSHKAALSFYFAEDMPQQKVTVVPPLLREQLFELETGNDGFLLVYLVNHGYSEEILAWHKEHPKTEIHCFYDKPGESEENQVDDTLTFHRLHGRKFLEKMGKAKGVVCTAGFESVCEAAYLDKPIMMVPVENHVEQELNAIDAEKVDFGVKSSDFNLSKLEAFTGGDGNRTFREWVDRADEVFLNLILRVAGRGASRDEAGPAESKFTQPAPVSSE
jgi:uncharacterized protein (TIGR00661 family)